MIFFPISNIYKKNKTNNKKSKTKIPFPSLSLPLSFPYYSIKLIKYLCQQHIYCIIIQYSKYSKSVPGHWVEELSKRGQLQGAVYLTIIGLNMV